MVGELKVRGSLIYKDEIVWAMEFGILKSEYKEHIRIPALDLRII